MMIRIRFLGGVSIERSGGSLAGPAAQRRRLGVLALLAVAREGGLSRDKLLGFLWPEANEESGRHRLSNALHVLRQALGPGAIVSNGGETLRIDPERVRIDLWEFRNALKQEEYEKAVALYSGPFLDGFFVSGAPEFDRWAEGQRDQLSRLYADALERLAEEREREVGFREAAEWWRRLAAHDPYSSRVALRLAKALASSGDSAGALQHADRHAALLRQDVGIEPDADLVAYEARLRAEPSSGQSGRPSHESSTAGDASNEVPAPATGLPVVIAPVPLERRPLSQIRRLWRSRSIRLGALLIVGILTTLTATFHLLGWGGGSAGDKAPALYSLALLPLTDSTGRVDGEYYADGVTEAITTALSGLPWLRVIAFSSMKQYREAAYTIPSVARDLHVDLVAAGTVWAQQDAFQINVRLSDGPSGRRLWEATYDRDTRHIRNLEVDAARGIGEAIQARLGTQPAPILHQERPVDQNVYTEYVRGRYYWSKRTAADLERALDHFRAALDQDPTFAPAYAGLADAYALMGAPAFTYRSPEEMFRLAKAAARRALELDPTLDQPHATLGFVASNYDWDWAAAEQELLRAVKLNPGNASAHQWYGLLLASLGRFEEATVEAHRARELDPLSHPISGSLARVYYYRGDHDRAIGEFQSTLANAPGTSWPTVGLAMVYLAQGRADDAITVLEQVADSFGGLTECVRGRALVALERREEALLLLRDLAARSSHEYVSPAYLAVLHSALGDQDQAYQWLERAYRERAGMLRFVNVDPLFDPLRDDDRFQEMLKRMGFESR